MTRFAALSLAFILSWTGEHVSGDVYRIDHRLAGASEWHQVAWTNSQCDTVSAVPGEINLYRITHIRGAEGSAPSDLRCGVGLIYTDELNFLQYVAYGGPDSALVTVALPTSLWDCMSTFNDSIPTSFRAESRYDYDRSGRVDLSDFVVFGETQWTIQDLARFATVYNTSARMEW
jgi:hypothetical protein